MPNASRHTAWKKERHCHINRGTPCALPFDEEACSHHVHMCPVCASPHLISPRAPPLRPTRLLCASTLTPPSRCAPHDMSHVTCALRGPANMFHALLGSKPALTLCTASTFCRNCHMAGDSPRALPFTTSTLPCPHMCPDLSSSPPPRYHAHTCALHAPFHLTSCTASTFCRNCHRTGGMPSALSV